MDSGTAFALGVVSGAVLVAVLSAACRREEKPVPLAKADEREDWREDDQSDPEDFWKNGRPNPLGEAG